MVAQDLVAAWEDAYREYGNAVGDDVTEMSRAVAGAWHGLATSVELPWWLSAAVRSAAQAFEHQAEDWAVRGLRRDGVVPTDEEGETGSQDHHGYQQVVLPTQQSSQRSCACTGEPSVRATA